MNTNIMFVDDEESIREAYNTILAPTQRRTSRRVGPATGPAKAEYTLFFAESGEKAVQIYQEQLAKGEPIAAGFFDMIMPGGIDGAETIRQIRAIDASIMCVIVTAYADRDPKEIREFFDDQSMWLYLNKPFNDGEIRQLASNMVAQFNLRKQNKAYHATMEALVKKRTEQLNAELEKVAIVQKNLLPQKLPKNPAFEIDVYYATCLELGGGGDYYDVIELSGNRLGLVIADASGHGPSAACIMAITRAMFRDIITHSNMSPGEVLKLVNERVEGNYPRGNFVTMFYGVLDLNTGHMISANAAHPFPVYGKANNFKIMEGKTGLIIGMFPSTYAETELQLSPGDHFFLFTDGLEEHKDAKREEFGYDRIVEVCNENGHKAPKELIESIIAKADAFRPDLPREDDFTFVSLRWTPKT